MSSGIDPSGPPMPPAQDGETSPPPAAGAPPPQAFLETGGGYRLVRGLLFLAAFFLIWLSVNPFRDLADPQLLDPAEDGNFANQVSILLLTATLAVFVVLSDVRIVLKALTPLLALTLAWFAFSGLFSDYPALVVRRLLLAVITIFNAAAVLMLPKDSAHFGRLLACAALALLALAFASVVLIPERAIHQSADLLDSTLAGDWRGPFPHKNAAGAGMAICIFIGFFVARAVNFPIGALVVVLSGVFLAFTQAKTPILLLPFVVLISFALAWIRIRSIRFSLVVAAPLMLAIVTIGSVSYEPIHDVLTALLPDPTFTSRDQIWRFTLDHIAQRPTIGFGFQAFWETGSLIFGASSQDHWVSRMSDAHNAFLNLAVMTGIVGSILATLWIVVQTAVDYVRTPSQADPALTTLFVQIWLFGGCVSAFESVFFAGGSSLWFMMLMSMLGLRFQRIALSPR